MKLAVQTYDWTTMEDRELLTLGVVGSAIAVVSCFTPALVLILGAVGLSAAVGWIDYALLLALAASVGVTIVALLRFRRGDPTL